MIELLVAVSLIAVLIAIALPSLGRARREGRRAVCLANLKQVALATDMYLDDNRDHYWRYFWRKPDGIRWWFGFELGGPAFSKPNRPLDKTQSVLAPFLGSIDDDLQCPSFPYKPGCYFPKFAARSASYGFNLTLGPANRRFPTKRRSDYRGRITSVFVFADGAHFDFSPAMNEGHYIDHVRDPTNVARGGGFGHFRHNRRAMVLYLDGHVEGQPLRGTPYPVPTCAGPCGNLTDPAGGSSIYGR